MTKHKYTKDGRLLFTKDMKKEYTILMPMMMPIHFTFIKNILEKYGYKIELLNTTHTQIINEGLQNVHNDTCYPALLVIGQLLDALKSGKYDINKTALIITQTGGGCRASNYIYLLRKALKKNHMENIPVVSFNVSGMEKNPGFKLTLGMIIQLTFAILYGDIIMLLANQTRPYEVNSGESDRLVNKWITKLSKEITGRNLLNNKLVKKNLELITADFASLPIVYTQKIKVGVVGEIYMKYSPLGNNNLEAFLLNEGAEVQVPGLLDFIIYTVDNGITDASLFGINRSRTFFTSILKKHFIKMQHMLIEAVKTQEVFKAPTSFEHIKTLAADYVGIGNKMGEGWLLTAEMLELVSSGVENIVCTQPFGCLPNHIVGKGMVRKIKDNYKNANIVAIDYDPGATKVNQENRLKLMLSTAKLNFLKKSL